MQSAATNTETFAYNKIYYLRLLTSIVISLFSGILSTYLYYDLEGKGGVYFPGLLYTSSTAITFLLTKTSIKIKNFLTYYFLMIITYVLIWLLTMYSSYIAFLCGIVTAGAGAIITFALTDKFITNIKYNKMHVFLVGGCSFFITDILYFTFSNIYDKTPFEYIFKVESSPNHLFMEVFIFWHTLVGTKLFLVLQTSSQTKSILDMMH